MSGFIVDPTDPDRAIAPSGALAGRLILLPELENPHAPTVAEMQRGTPIGWIDPIAQPAFPNPDLEIKYRRAIGEIT